MITKIRSLQDSWFVKGILILTALSFMSLFGISGYINRSGANAEVIKVGDVVVYQDDINQQYEQQLQMTKNIFGEDFDISDEMRNAMVQNIVQKELINAIVKETAKDFNISISDDLIRKIIYSQAEFMDANGNFSLEKMRRMLSLSGWSEQRYINTLRQDIIKQHLLQNPVENINIPQFMNKFLNQLENQKKVFRYVSINPDKMIVDRKISEEELQQYYDDFAPQFEEPEKRDISFIKLSLDQLSSGFTPSEEEVEMYYQDNISQYVIPEKRHVLQMIFNSQQDADKAMAALNAGGDFYNVAKDIAKQSREDTDFGLVSKDMLIADISDAVFGLKKGEIAGPIKSELGWHIMKVTSIVPQKETKLAAAKAQIIETIRKENAYDQAAEVVAEIEDKLGGGATLEDIASQYKVGINKISALGEDGQAKKMDPKFKKVAASADFIDTAFSYNSGEISQVLEEDDGFYIIRVDDIQDAHLKDLAEVKPQIQKMWTDNEKNAIAQEVVNDVMHDLENGDNIDNVARRFNLVVKTTQPLKKSENFATLSPKQMVELFQNQIGEPKQLSLDEEVIVAVPTKTIKASKNVSAKELDAIRSNAKTDMAQETANELADAFASNYDVEVEYKQLGLAD